VGFLIGIITSPLKEAMIPGFVFFVVVSFSCFVQGKQVFLGHGVST